MAHITIIEIMEGIMDPASNILGRMPSSGTIPAGTQDLQCIRIKEEGVGSMNPIHPFQPSKRLCKLELLLDPWMQCERLTYFFNLTGCKTETYLDSNTWEQVWMKSQQGLEELIASLVVRGEL